MILSDKIVVLFNFLCNLRVEIILIRSLTVTITSHRVVVEETLTWRFFFYATLEMKNIDTPLYHDISQ